MNHPLRYLIMFAAFACELMAFAAPLARFAGHFQMCGLEAPVLSVDVSSETLSCMCQSPGYATVLALDKAGSETLQLWPRLPEKNADGLYFSGSCSARINFDVDVHDIECRNLQVLVYVGDSEGNVHAPVFACRCIGIITRRRTARRG